MQKENFYKVAFFTLLIIILLSGIAFGILAYGKNRFNAGKQLAFSSIVESVNNSGYVTLIENEQNTSVSLVPAQLLDLAIEQTRQRTILEIIEKVKKDGYITLYANLSENYTEITLVPLPTQS